MEPEQDACHLPSAHFLPDDLVTHSHLGSHVIHIATIPVRLNGLHGDVHSQQGTTEGDENTYSGEHISFEIGRRKTIPEYQSAWQNNQEGSHLLKQAFARFIEEVDLFAFRVKKEFCDSLSC